MSRMALAHGCLYGFRVDVQQTPRPPGRAARIGSCVHQIVELTVAGAPWVISDLHEKDLDVIAEAKEIFEGPLHGFVASRKWTACEVGLRLDADTDTCTAGPRRGEDGYDEAPAMTLPGTLDLVFVESGVAHVFDVKTGRPPTDREQLYAQAVAVSRLYDAPRVEVAYARALKTKLDVSDAETLDADRLDAESGRIAKLLRRLPIAEPKAGDYCWKCDARPDCPEYGAVRADEKASDLEAAGFFA